MTRATVRHMLQTPTFALTSAGSLALAARLLRWHRGLAETLAFAFFLGAAGGLAIALWVETERKGQRWGWRGLYRALRRPSREFLFSVAAHAPQLVLALALVAGWRRRNPQRA